MIFKIVYLMDIMKEIYTTGKFAKKANVTERTIRYYDKIGLLKPSFVMENGYRCYSDEDLLKLQRIISLKNLGFSLEEIYPLTLKNDKDSLVESLDLQLDLVKKKIQSLENLRETLFTTKSLLKNNEIEWNRIVELLQLSKYDEEIIEQYRNSNNLSIRMNLHDRYSINKMGWFNWLFSHIDFTHSNRILEIGCGDGKLWKDRPIDLRNREVFLSDSSSGMIHDVRKSLGDDFSYMVFECENIPFKKGYFDIIIANHVLFYLKDIQVGLSEISRVLVNDGKFYCTSYGKNHMKEITEICQEFDNHILLSRNNLSDLFGLENGKEVLLNHFNSVDLIIYDDYLIIDDSEALIAYIMSCHGNQKEILKNQLDKFKEFLDDKINKQGFIKITKEAGLFICKK